MAGSSAAASEHTLGPDEAYYRDLLSRVDSTIAQTHKQVTFSGAYEQLSEAEVHPLRHLAREHSILGLCWHRDVENGFTRPLKMYFCLSSTLFALFLSLEIELATFFAEWCIITLLLHLGHWGQQMLFFKFQNSLLLWPFCSAFVLIFFLIYDLWRLVWSSRSAVGHAMAMFFTVYLFGFIAIEGAVRAYKLRKKKSEIVDDMGLDLDADYSTL